MVRVKGPGKTDDNKITKRTEKLAACFGGKVHSLRVDPFSSNTKFRPIFLRFYLSRDDFFFNSIIMILPK